MRLSGSVLCGLTAFLITAFFFVQNVATWPARLSYPGDESYEGVAVAEMIHIRQGVPTYAASTDRYDDATYGPLYYLLAGRLVDLGAPSYFPLRLLSALAISGCAAGCGLLAFWLSDSYMAGLLSPLVFLSYGMVSGNGIQALSDSVALFLSFTGFLVAYWFQQRRAILVAAPLMILSFYYKPQYVAGPVAVFIFLAAGKKYRLATEFAGLSAFCGIVLFSFFQWVAFPGQAFWRHFLFTQNVLLTWQQFEKALFIFSFMLLLPVLFAIEYLRAYPNRILSFYLFLAVVLGILTYSKDGSGVHYFFESVLVLSTVLPVLMVKQSAVHRYPVHLLLVLAIMLVAGQWSTKRSPQPTDFAQHNAMQSFLTQNFPAHANALGASPGELLQAQLKTPFSGLFTFAQLARRGLVSDHDLVSQIDSRRFAVIVLSFDLSQERDPYWLNFSLTPATRAAIKQDYVLIRSLAMPAPVKQRAQDRYYIYVPGGNELNRTE